LLIEKLKKFRNNLNFYLNLPNYIYNRIKFKLYKIFNNVLNYKFFGYFKIKLNK